MSIASPRRNGTTRGMALLFLLLTLSLLFVIQGCKNLDATKEPAPGDRVVIRDGHFMLNGERFIIKGIGYEPGTRPGQYPWQRKFEPDVLRADLDRIRSAGFNTLRCWSGYTDEELAVMEEKGFWVIQGIWIVQNGAYEDQTFIQDAVERVSKAVTMSRKHKNILMYVVMNEPPTESILKSGQDNFIQLIRTLRDCAHALDPEVPVTFANTTGGDFFDLAALDAAAFNLYPYSTVTIQKVLGYRGYIEWLRRNQTPGQPLLITEYGLSVSPKGEGRLGYGGNSLQDQAEGDVWMLDSMIQGGADGGCAFMYADGWWKNADKPDDANVHDDDPEEWYGLIGIESESKPEGTPRPAFTALQRENAALWIQPVSWKEYPETVPVEVYAGDDVSSVQLETETGQVFQLKRSGNWWRLNLPSTTFKSTEKIHLSALSQSLGEIRKDRNLVTRWQDLPEEFQPVDFALEDSSPLLLNRSSRVVRATYRNGFPVANRTFTVGIHEHEGWARGVSKEVTSDENGRITINLGPFSPSGVVTISVSTGYVPMSNSPVWGNAFVLRTVMKSSDVIIPLEPLIPPAPPEIPPTTSTEVPPPPPTLEPDQPPPPLETTPPTTPETAPTPPPPAEPPPESGGP